MHFIKQIFKNKLDLILTLSIVLSFLAIITYNLLWGVNGPQTFVVLEHRAADTLTVVREPGSFFQGINGAHYWEYANMIWFSSHKDEGANKDESIPLQFIDGAKGNQSGNMLYAFDFNMPDSVMIGLQVEYRDQRNFEDRGVKPLLIDAMRVSASITSSEEAYTTKKKEIGFMAFDQLQNGVYQVIVEGDSVTDFSGETIFKDVTKIVVERDKNGKPILDEKGNEIPKRTGKSLSNFHAQCKVFSLYEVDFDDEVDKIIAKKLEANMDRIISLALTQLENKRNYLEEVKGQVQIKEQEYKTKENNEVMLVRSQLFQDTTRILSRARVQVSHIKKQIALLKKKTEKLKGKKEFKIRQLNMNADKQLYPRLEAYKQKEISKANAYGNATRVNPKVNLSADGSGKPINQGQLSLELMNSNAANNMFSSASKPKSK